MTCFEKFTSSVDNCLRTCRGTVTNKDTVHVVARCAPVAWSLPHCLERLLLFYFWSTDVCKYFWYRLSDVRCYKHKILSSLLRKDLDIVCDPLPHFISGILIKIFCYQVCLCLTWVRQTAEQNPNNLKFSLSHCHVGGSLMSWLFTAECTIMTLFCRVCAFQTWGTFVQNPPSCLLTVRPQSTYLFCCSSESRSCLQSEHIFAHCVYSANYAWRLCTPSAPVGSPQMNLFLRLVVEVLSVCLDHSFICLPIPCPHLYVTSDEQSCCSLLETLHGSLAL